MRKAGQSTKFLMDCIAQSLLERMKKKEYSEISISEICRHAGVGRTTFYRHFTANGTKDDVLIYYAASLWSDYCETRKEEVEKDTWGALMNFIYDRKEFFSAIGNARLEHVLFSIFYKTIGPSEDDIPEIAFFKSFFAGAVFGITYNWIEAGFVKSPSELTESIGKIIAARTVSEPVTAKAEM